MKEEYVYDNYKSRTSDASFLATFLAWFWVLAERNSGQMFQHLFMLVSASEFVLADTSLSLAARVEVEVGMSEGPNTPPFIAFQASSAARFTTISLKVGNLAFLVNVDVLIRSLRV